MTSLDQDPERTEESGGLTPEPSSTPGRKRFKGRIAVQGGRPIEILERVEVTYAEPQAPEVDSIAETLGSYQRAAKELLSGKYRELAEVAPAHMRVPCDCWALVCDDGIILRWDKHEGQDKPKVRIGRPEDGPTTISELVPGLSERHVYCPMDVTEFELPADGPKIQFAKVNHVTREQAPIIEAQIGLVVNWGEIVKHPPTAANRPIPLVSVGNELHVDVHGEEFDASTDPRPGTGQEFVLAGRMRLAVGWETIEIYPPFDAGVWRPAVAKDWAELDLLAAAARHNLRQQQLDAIDPRAATRREYANRLKQFRSLLNGPEADLQEFLENNPQLLSPTHLRMWKKVPLGRRVTDFVFKEPNDYVLVEIEAPSRPLFRKDGQQSEELTHAIDQVNDWLRYIQDNPDTVHRELGLEGISPHPVCLIVIGRSETLREADRRKLVTMQGTLPKFRIWTYDDALVSATQSISNLLGSIPETEGAVEIYYRWGRAAVGV